MNQPNEVLTKFACWCSLDSHDRIRIRLTDEDSRASIEVDMSPEDFTFMINHRHISNVEGRVFRQNEFGKVKVTEPRRIALPTDVYRYDRKQTEKWLETAGREDGWEVNTYLGSQGSITSDGDTYYANYIVFKYVDKETVQ